MTEYLFLAAAIATNMVGHVLFKAGAVSGTDAMRVYVHGLTLGGFAAYGFSAFAYIAALRTRPLSVAMPSMVLGYVGASLCAYWLWNEPFGTRQMASLVLIGFGLYLLHR